MAADLFCQKHGFQRADQWATDYGYGMPTLAIQDNQPNNYGSQDGLKNVHCVNRGSSSGSSSPSTTTTTTVNNNPPSQVIINDYKGGESKDNGLVYI